jgi:Flp pilus assembly pilin Flp
MRRYIESVARDGEAQDLVEYSLLLAFIAMATIAIAMALGANVSFTFGTAQNTIGTALNVANGI